MANPIFILDIGPDGVVATHPWRVEMPALVAPVPEERKTQELNTLRQQLVTIACKLLPGDHFEFDSSFVGPRSEQGFTKFAEMMKRLKEQDPAEEKDFPPIAVFGHTDPTGGDQYNKPLAGRRALAVYGLLIRNTKIWSNLYNKPYRGDRWGLRSIRTILSVLKPQAQPDGAAFYSGPLEAPEGDPQAKKQIDNDTRAAIKAFKDDRFPPPNAGFPDDATRQEMFAEYMDAICHFRKDGPFSLDQTKHFIAHNRDSKTHRADLQGCSDFNLVFRLSKAEEDLFNSKEEFHKTRNDLYAVNRRVVVYVFKHGTDIDPVKWPCPAAADPSGAQCSIRFWSDHKKRVAAGKDRRTFGKDMDLFERGADGNLVLNDSEKPNARQVEETGNTMACRWYHAFAIHSPCERKMEEWIVRIRVDSPRRDPEPLVGRRFVVIAGEAEFSPVIRGTTNEFGEVRIPVLDERTKMTLKLDAWGKLFQSDDESKPANAGQEAKEDLASRDSGSTDASAGGKPSPNSGFDGDRFPDEDKFLTFTLDAGALRRMPESGELSENDLPAKQRLYNLGFGQNDPAHWTDEEFKTAVRQYRKFRALGKDSNIDPNTRLSLLKDHELSDPGPPEDDGSSQPGSQPADGDGAGPLGAADSAADATPSDNTNEANADSTDNGDHRGGSGSEDAVDSDNSGNG